MEAKVSLALIENTEIKPWSRMTDEPTFWYNRYKRYQSLGPKRTVLAALQQERASSKALKGTQNQGKAKAKAVPGSWKQASIKWCWVERALAFDEDKIERAVAALFEELYEGPAMAFNRVMTLKNIHIALTNDFNENRARMTHQERIAYYAQMRRILHDIADEMKAFDAPTQALLVRHFAAKEYRDYKSPTSPEGYVQLVEKAGGISELHTQLEAEIARRKELAQLKEAFGE